MKHPAPATRWATALTAAFAMSQANASPAAPAAIARQGGAPTHDLPRPRGESGHQHHLADDAALLEGPQHLWGVG